MADTADTIDLTTAADRLDNRAWWQSRYRDVRGLTEALASPLGPEDQLVQSMPDASPTKWHRAHTTWFFETFLLMPHLTGYRVHDPAFGFLFNSYYEAVGPRHPRPQRGLLTRPTIAEVAAYRVAVDAAIIDLIGCADARNWAAIAPLLELGLNHEQQHQELILTDIKHAFFCNPLMPAYRQQTDARPRGAMPQTWIECPGGIHRIGHDGIGFAFDNEGPAHDVLLRPYRLAKRPVSVGEFRDFIADGGYQRAEFWLSEGWHAVREGGWERPFYWLDDRHHFTLSGVVPLIDDQPVCHVTLFEAAAFAAWAGARLATEFEWEAAWRAQPYAVAAEDYGLHPSLPSAVMSRDLVAGGAWEWTGSAYAPYPGFRAASGAVGEYNAKFMSSQMVLRGRSCTTPPGHARVSYRNFFPPGARWQFSGFRLAEDL